MIELGRLEKHVTQENKPKSIALKVDSKEKLEEEIPDEDKKITILVKRFGEFIQNDKTLNFDKRRKFFKKNETYTSTQNFTCFEYGNQGQIKADSPKLSKKSDHQGRKESKSKKAYIAWDENEVS